MAIGIVELQGTINRTQDFQQFQQYENEKGMIYQNNQQTQVEQNVEDKLNLVHEKENAAEDTEANDEGSGGMYGGDGGRNRQKKKLKDRIVKKSTMAFDVKI